MMNKAKQLIKFIEDVINPEDKYLDDAKEKTTTSGPHKKLTSEAQRQLKEAGGTEALKKAAHYYSKDGYAPMNDHLRHGHALVGVTKDHLSSLKTLTKNPTKHEFYAYRGVTKNIDGAEKEGDVFQDHGFTSTSLRTGTANKFSKKSSEGRMFRVHITPGTKGHYISGHDRIEGSEREFVLHPNTKFRVGKTVTHPSGRQFTELHIHSQED